MNPVFTALVPALQVGWGNWWTTGDGDTSEGWYDDDSWDD